jgi:hypothetical protein
MAKSMPDAEWETDVGWLKPATCKYYAVESFAVAFIYAQLSIRT